MDFFNTAKIVSLSRLMQQTMMRLFRIFFPDGIIIEVDVFFSTLLSVKHYEAEF
jgi:hypothetical protein